MQEVRTARRPPAPLLSLRDWITTSDLGLKALGHDASDRIQHTGHVKSLKGLWHLSVGHWGLRDFSDLVKEDGTGPLLFMSRDAFYKFKVRWKLRSRSEHVHHFGPLEWSVATQCLNAVNRAAKQWPGASTGVLASRCAEPVGVLPVEVVLHLLVLRRVMEQLGGEPLDWLGLDTTQRAKLWWGNDGRLEQAFDEPIYGAVGP